VTGAALWRAATAGAGAPALPDRVVVAVLVLAVASLGFRLGSGADPLATAVVTAAVLVAGAPLARPLARRALPAAARRRAAGLGVPLDDCALARLGGVDTLVLPRAGAITTGDAELRATTAAPGEAADEVRRFAAAVERPAGHALARAIVPADDATADGDPLGVADFDAVPGRGVRGVVSELVDGRVLAHAVLVGSPAFLLDHGVDLPAELAAARDAVEGAGRLAVAVAWDGVARGVLDVEQPLRPDAGAALAAARRAGVRPVVVTAAGPAVAAVLAQRLGAPDGDVLVEPRPGGAAEVVRWLRAGGAVTAAAVPADGALVGLPVPASGAAGLVDVLRLAARLRRVAAAVHGLSSAAAVGGAAAAAAGLLDPVLAPAVPAAGGALVAGGWLAVAVFGWRFRKGPGPGRDGAAAGVAASG
jgi:P-type Cu+ transporter